MYAVGWTTVVSGGVAAFEPAVGHVAEIRFRAESLDPGGELGGATGAGVGSNVEVGQLAREQARNARADGVAVI